MIWILLMYGNDKHYENDPAENYIKIVVKNSGKSLKERFSTVFLIGNCLNRYAYFFAKSFIIAAIF